MKNIILRITISEDRMSAALYGLTPTTEDGQWLFDEIERQVATNESVLGKKHLTDDMILWALRRHDGKVAAAARFLCVPRSTLRSALARKPELASLSVTQ